MVVKQKSTKAKSKANKTDGIVIYSPKEKNISKEQRERGRVD